jgi:PAS domain S-box-containing protein
MKRLLQKDDPVDNLRQSDLQSFVDTISIPAALTSYDTDEPVILAANKPHEELTGYKNSEVLGKTPRIFKGELTEQGISHRMKFAVKHYHWWEGTLTNHHKNGKPYVIQLKIMGVVIDKQRYLLATKTKRTYPRISIRWYLKRISNFLTNFI